MSPRRASPNRASFHRFAMILLLMVPLCTAQDRQDPTLAVHALIDSATALIRNNHPDEAIQKLHAAYQIGMDAGDGDLVALTCLYLGMADLVSGDEQEGQKAFETAVSLLEKAGANDQIAGSLQGAVGVSRKYHRHDSEIKLLQTLADTYGRMSNFKAQADTLSDLLEAYDQTTEMHAFCNTLEHILPLYQKLDDRPNLAASWFGEGKCHESSGDTAGAIADYKKSIDAFRALGDKSNLAAVLDSTAEALRAHGRLAEALPLQKEAVSIRKDLNVPRDYAQSLNDLAMVDQGLGYLPDAVTAIEESVRITRIINDPAALATSLSNEAAVYRDVGRTDEAFRALDESLKVARDACLTDEAKSAMKVRATIYAVTGDALSAAASEAVANDTTDICPNKKKSAVPADPVAPVPVPVRMLPAALAIKRGGSDALAALQAPSWILTDEESPVKAVNTLLESAADMLKQKQIDQAISTLDKALPLAQKSGNGELLAATYIWIGNAQLRKGNDQDAQKAIDSGVELLQRAGSQDDVRQAFQMAIDLGRENKLPATEARYLQKLAVLYRDSEQFDDSLKSLNEALQVSRQACLSSEARSAMKLMATVHSAMGKAGKAAEEAALAEDTRDVCAEKQQGTANKDNKEPAYMTTHNMSIALVQMGAYPKAIENFKADLKKAEADHDLAASASAHEGLGYAYGESSQFALAESNLLEAERIERELGNPHAISRVQMNLATLYIGMGRYYDALDLYDKIQRTAALQDIQLQINTLLTTSDIYRHLKSYDQAFDDAQRALQISEKTGFRNLTATAQQDMGLVQLARENYDDAEALFRESARNWPGSPVLDDALVELYLATGRYANAENELGRASADVLAGAKPTYRLQYYTQRGIARLGLNRFPEAVADFNSAIKEAEELRTQVLGGKSTGFLDAGSFGGRVRPYRGMVEAFASLSISGLPVKAAIGENEVDTTHAAFHFAELTRGRSLSEKLAVSRMEELRKQVPQSLLDQEKRLADEVLEFARKYSEAHSGSPPTSAEAEEFVKFRTEARIYLDNLEKKYPLYARVFTPGTIPVDELPVAKDEALLEYAIGLHDIFLFLVSSDHSLRCYRLSMSLRQMQAKVRAFRNLIVAKRFSSSLAYDLFSSLLGTVPHYDQLPRRLVIIPDGFLALLPFEALNTTQTGDPRFLAASHSIIYAQSASVLTWTREFTRAPTPKPLFALADPVFAPTDPRMVASPSTPQATAPRRTDQAEDSMPLPSVASSTGHTFRRLPETQIEVETLATILGIEPRPPDVLIGASAAKTTVQKTDLAAYRYLHFATHAALGEPGRVNEPFLVLNQVGNPLGDNGLLTMTEIMDLKLNSELVVLGACDTGAGDVLEGDGVASLASAFQFAGAESVVLSLWELPSEATLPFMRAFYQQLKQGRSKLEALQSGREAMRRQYPDPYYWAVFALYSGAA